MTSGVGGSLPVADRNVKVSCCRRALESFHLGKTSHAFPVFDMTALWAALYVDARWAAESSVVEGVDVGRTAIDSGR